MRLLLLLAMAACSKPVRRVELADYLYKLTGTDEATRANAVASWKIDRDAWDRVVVEPYRLVYNEYAAELDAARPALVAQLATSHSIVTKAHFAADPTTTVNQAIARWALPTLAKTRLAELAGKPPTPLDVVFVEVDGRWQAIAGIAAIVRRHVAALDPACAIVIDQIAPAGGPCIEAAWGVADAALREDRPRFAHACGLAVNLCGKPTP